LAHNRWLLAATDGVHSPAFVKIIQDVHIAVTNPDGKNLYDYEKIAIHTIGKQLHHGNRNILVIWFLIQQHYELCFLTFFRSWYAYLQLTTKSSRRKIGKKKSVRQS